MWDAVLRQQDVVKLLNMRNGDKNGDIWDGVFAAEGTYQNTSRKWEGCKHE